MPARQTDTWGQMLVVIKDQDKGHLEDSALH